MSAEYNAEHGRLDFLSNRSELKGFIYGCLFTVLSLQLQCLLWVWVLYQGRQWQLTGLLELLEEAVFPKCTLVLQLDFLK